MAIRRLRVLLLLPGIFCLALSCGSSHTDPVVPPDNGNQGADVQPPVQTGWPEAGMESKTYLHNDKVQIGVDLERGGGIFHFSDATNKKNVLNHFDEGRFMQQSYYGDEDGSNWNGTPWRWNPVQGGGWNGVKATVLSKEISETQIKVVTQPVHWANCTPLTDCRMTETITLDGAVAHIRFQFSCTSTKAHKARHQELPAVFCDWDLANLVTYSGTSPWTGASLTRLKPEGQTSGIKNAYMEKLNENWVAYVNDKDWGAGVYTPGTNMITYYRFGSGPGGPRASSCSYFSPIRTMAVTAGFSFSYDVYLTIGTVDEIRAAFKKIAGK